MFCVYISICLLCLFVLFLKRWRYLQFHPFSRASEFPRWLRFQASGRVAFRLKKYISKPQLLFKILAVIDEPHSSRIIKVIKGNYSPEIHEERVYPSKMMG